MKALRTRLASLLVMVSAGSLALLQSASGLAGVSEANTNPETQDLYRRDHDAGHRKHYQHHGHRSHTDHHHKHHDKEGKGKQDGPHHKAKDKHHHHKHHKKPNVPTCKLVAATPSMAIVREKDKSGGGRGRGGERGRGVWLRYCWRLIQIKAGRLLASAPCHILTCPLLFLLLFDGKYNRQNLLGV